MSPEPELNQPPVLTENADESVRLKDVTEDVPLPEELRPGARRRRRLLMLVALMLLLPLTVVGGYLLLRGRRVEVRPSRRAPEKITSGADLQKAAFDSLSGSLAGPLPSVSPGTTAANIGAGQPSVVAMAGVTPAPAASPAAGESAKAPPVQSGIALTLAPPPEAQPREAPASPEPARNPAGQNERGMEATTLSATTASGNVKPKVGATINFTHSLAAPATSSSNTVVTPAATVTTPLPLKEPVKAAGSSVPEPRDLPAFGAMLPVRSLGLLYTLRQGSLARLELTRDYRSGGRTLRKGAIFVGTVLSGELDRAFLQIRGFIEPDSETFTPLTGEVLGSDGGAGLRGRQRRVASAWLTVLDRAAQSGTQLLSGLLGRPGSSVIIATDPYNTWRSASGDALRRQDNRSFVEVPAGTAGYILVTRLPDTAAASASTTSEENTTGQLSETELADLLSNADPDRLRAALPRLSPELRRLAQLALQGLEPEL